MRVHIHIHNTRNGNGVATWRPNFRRAGWRSAATYGLAHVARVRNVRYIRDSDGIFLWPAQRLKDLREISGKTAPTGEQSNTGLAPSAAAEDPVSLAVQVLESLTH